MMHPYFANRTIDRAARAFALTALSLCAATRSEAEAPKDLPIPQITFQGENVTFHKKPIRVAVGQKITLDADQKGTSQYWSISPGDTYGSVQPFDKPPNCPYFPDVKESPCAVYTDPDFSKPETTFYFLDPGTYQITYNYFKADGKNASSYTTFEADAPQLINATFQTGSVQIDCSADCKMVFTNPNIVGFPGIEIEASGKDPKGIPGTFLWSQQVWKIIAFAQDGHAYNCPEENGLDNRFPYQKGSTLTDRPGIGLLAAEQYVIEQFGAHSELLWQAKKSDYVLDSTPVDLGRVEWAWDAFAFNDPNQGWIIQSSDVAPPVFINYGTPFRLEPWNTVLLNSYNPDCAPG